MHCQISYNAQKLCHNHPDCFTIIIIIIIIVAFTLLLRYRQLGTAGAVSDQLLLTKHVVEIEGNEENFLESVGWLAFATALATGTCGFVQWVHADGLKRRNEAGSQRSV